MLYLAAPTVDEYERTVFGSGREAADAFSRADRHNARELLAVVDDARAVLKDAAKHASRNAGRLRDLAAAADILHTIYRFGAAGRSGVPGWRGALRSLQAAWKRTRYCDGPAYRAKARKDPRGTDRRDQIITHLNRLGGA
jgi:hypothetical protein